MQKGFKHSTETRKKMQLAAFTRDNTNRLKAIPKGNNHWGWQENPNVRAIHRRLGRWFGKASQFPCFDCGKKAHDWSNENGNYTDDIKDYRPRCRSCHVKKDKNWIKKN